MTYLGLRPGEKLYEELLVKTEELDKTDNSLIFIERDTALSNLNDSDSVGIVCLWGYIIRFFVHAYTSVNFV